MGLGLVIMRKEPTLLWALLYWWARWDSNPGPKDYACHHDFRRPFRVCGLDYTFPLQAGRLVSTPSTTLSHRSLARCWHFLEEDEAFTDFDQFYLSPEQTWRQATH